MAVGFSAYPSQTRWQRAVQWLRANRACVVCALLGAAVGVFFERSSTPLCPPDAACIFGPPGAEPYVEFAEVPGTWAVYDVQRKLHETQSAYQTIAVYDTYFHGRILTIDGALMITERDERNYHEMLAHVPLNYLPAAKRVLVIGGGDGGTVTQVVRHSNLASVSWVEIDEQVVKTSRKYFTRVSAGLDDPRVKLVVRNAAHWVAEQRYTATRDAPAGGASAAGGEDDEIRYDVVLIDSTDFNQAEPLFTPDFYAGVKALMRPTSILCFNLDSPQWGQVRLVQFADRLSALFTHVYVYQVFQPTYSSGHYAFLFASDSVHPTQTAVDWGAWLSKNIETRYYTPDVHYAAFMLPAQVRGVLRSAPLALADVAPRGSQGFAPAQGEEDGAPVRTAGGAAGVDGSARAETTQRAAGAPAGTVSPSSSSELRRV